MKVLTPNIAQLEFSGIVHGMGQRFFACKNDFCIMYFFISY